MEVGEQAGAYLVIPGTAPTLHARLRFRLLIRLLFPTLGRPIKEQQMAQGRKGPREHLGQHVREAQTGAVTRPRGMQIRTWPLAFSPQALIKPLHGLFSPPLHLRTQWVAVSHSLAVILTSHLLPAWERCSMQGLCDMIPQRVDRGKCS